MLEAFVIGFILSITHIIAYKVGSAKGHKEVIKDMVFVPDCPFCIKK